jgi:hypothetical protein
VPWEALLAVVEPFYPKSVQQDVSHCR